MKNKMQLQHARITKLIFGVFLGSLLSVTTFAQSASAVGVLTSRSLTLTNPGVAAGATVTYAFKFTTTSSTTILSFDATICTTASGTCTTPTGFVNSSSINAPTGLGSGGSWTASSATAGHLRISNASNTGSPSAGAQVYFTNVTNPSSVGTFFARLTTYSDASWTTALDTSTVASSIVNAITVTASVDETMTFCVYNTGGTCADSSTTPVALGTLSTASTKTATSQMNAATNASGGLTITYYGDTLKTGAGQSIAAIGSTATASSINTPQFGINLAANTTPAVGSAPSGGSVVAVAPYDGLSSDLNKFAYLVSTTATPQSIANSGGAPTNTTILTVSYIANINGTTAAGSYSTVVTYICAATF